MRAFTMGVLGAWILVGVFVFVFAVFPLMDAHGWVPAEHRLTVEYLAVTP